jgi:hypothetical protein
MIIQGLNLGLHSVRSGGASGTARSDVNERCIKRDCQWKSDVSKDGYISDTFRENLSINLTHNYSETMKQTNMHIFRIPRTVIKQNTKKGQII